MKPQGDITRSMALPICSMVMMLIFGTSPFIAMFWQVSKGASDMKRARDELKRTMNPDELRAWVFSQVKKHPEGGYSEEAEKEWPETFPHFADSRYFSVYLYPSNVNQGSLDTLGASLVWDFSGGCYLKVSVSLTPDGTLPEMKNEREWVRGIAVDMLGK